MFFPMIYLVHFTFFFFYFPLHQSIFLLLFVCISPSSAVSHCVLFPFFFSLKFPLFLFLFVSLLPSPDISYNLSCSLIVLSYNLPLLLFVSLPLLKLCMILFLFFTPFLTLSSVLLIIKFFLFYFHFVTSHSFHTVHNHLLITMLLALYFFLNPTHATPITTAR